MTSSRRNYISRLLVLWVVATGTLAATDAHAQPRADKVAAVSSEAVSARLEAVWKTEEPGARARAMADVVALGPGAVPHLAVALEDHDASFDQRSAVAWVLGELGDPAAIPPLEAAWAGTSEAPGTFRMQLAIALASLGKREPLRSFVVVGGDPILLAKAATGLANVGDKEAVPLLEPFLRDESIGVFVAMAMGRLGDARGHEQLKEALKEGMLRDHAAIALGMSGDKTVVYQVRFALENPDPFVRRDAVTVLGRLKDRESLARVEAMAEKDVDKRVREAAVVAVRRIEPRRRR